MTTTLEQLQQVMDDYGNVRYLLEDLKSAKETALQKILEKYPEVAQEIQSMEEEFDPKIENAENVEKTKKKLLEACARDYAQEIILKDKGEVKSKLIRIGLDRKVEYDVNALEGMALENPKLLGLRSEKISTRVTLLK
jgi:vacuolar-type H+-ATPase subunit H